MTDSLKLPLLYSALGHIIVVLFFTVKAVFFSEAVMFYEPVLRVDIVDLPDKISSLSAPEMPASKPPDVQPETKVERAPEVSPKIKELSKEEPEVVLSKTKDKASKTTTADAIKKLKKQLAIEKIKEDLRHQEKEALSTRVSTFKGNVISPGTELYGVNKLQHENYLGSLDSHVKKFWSLPEWLARGNFSARVRIFLDDQGMLIKTQLLKSSGNPTYDDVVLDTVKKAMPYPLPPEKFRAIVSVNGMVLGFPE